MFLFKKESPTGRISKFIYYAILGYIVSLFLKNSPVVSNLFMAAIFGMAWFAKPLNFKQLAQNIKGNKVIAGLLIFFLLEFISAIFSHDKQGGFDMLRVRLSLLVLPLAFLFIDFDQKTWRRILIFYVVLAVAASLIGFSFGVVLALETHNPGYLYNDNISYQLVGKQAAYYSFYVDIAIFILLYLYRFRGDYSKGFKVFLWAGFIWLLFMNYMLASTMSTIALALLLFATVVVWIIKGKKLLAGALLLIGIAAGVIALNALFPKTFVRFERLTKTSYRFDNTATENHFDAAYNPDQWTSSSTRLALWHCGVEIWQEHPVAGVGLGDLKGALIDKFDEKHFWSALSNKRNLHSQYVDILAATGIIGILVFLATYIVYPVVTFIKRKQSLAILVFTGLAICLLTENMFDRYQGEVLIGLMLPLAQKLYDEDAGEAEAHLERLG